MEPAANLAAAEEVAKQAALELHHAEAVAEQASHALSEAICEISRRLEQSEDALQASCEPSFDGTRAQIRFPSVPLLKEDDEMLVVEARAICSTGTPPTVVMVIAGCVLAILGAISRKLDAAAFVEGRVPWATIRLEYTREDELVERMKRGFGESLASAKRVAAIAPAVQCRLAGVGLSEQRAERATAAAAALLRWCNTILTAAAEVVRPLTPRAAAPARQPAANEPAVPVALQQAALVAQERLAQQRVAYEAAQEAVRAAKEEVVFRENMDFVRSLRPTPTAPAPAPAPQPQRVEELDAAAVEAAPWPPGMDESDSGEEGPDLSIEQPQAVLRQCVQFRRGSAEVLDDQDTVLRNAAHALQMHEDLEAAAVGIREEFEDPQVDLQRAEAVRAVISRHAGPVVGRRVRCVAGGALPGRGHRRTEFCVLRRVELPQPIVFAWGSCQLTPVSRPALRSLARLLLTGPTLRLCLEGFVTHGEGEDVGEAQLGFLRADAVRVALQRRGVDTDAQTEAPTAWVTSAEVVAGCKFKCWNTLALLSLLNSDRFPDEGCATGFEQLLSRRGLRDKKRGHESNGLPRPSVH